MKNYSPWRKKRLLQMSLSCNIAFKNFKSAILPYLKPHAKKITDGAFPIVYLKRIPFSFHRLYTYFVYIWNRFMDFNTDTFLSTGIFAIIA